MRTRVLNGYIAFEGWRSMSLQKATVRDRSS